VPERGGGDDELAHELGVADRELERRRAAHAVAHHVGAQELQVPHQRRRVVGHELVGDRRVAVARAPVAAHVDGDHLPGLGEPGEQRTHHVEVHVRAVQQDQRRARPVDLVVHAQVVDRRVAARRHLGSPPSSGCRQFAARRAFRARMRKFLAALAAKLLAAPSSPHWGYPHDVTRR